MAAGSLETIFAALQRAGVRYLVVGGVAVVLHGHPGYHLPVPRSHRTYS
jgi:hypothetical protein